MFGGIWRAVILILLLLPVYSLAQTQDSHLSAAALAEREALIAGGYPLFDASGQLTEFQRDILLQQLDQLKTCCDLDISLVLQRTARNASATQDIEVLLAQLQRTGLWTEKSLIILLQMDPRRALAIRADAISNRTKSLGNAELQTLGAALAEGNAADALIQALEALSSNLDSENLSLALWTLGVPAQEALYHFCVFWLFACLFTAAFWLLNRRKVLPNPVLLKRIRTGGHSFKPSIRTLNSGIEILFILQRRAPRHFPTLLGVSLFVGLIGVFILEPFFWGLEMLWQQWRLWVFIDYWWSRAFLNLALITFFFLFLVASPVGAWITPRALFRVHQSRLLANNIQKHEGLGRMTLIIVWRRLSQQLEVWEPAHANLANPRMETLLDRLEADFSHGQAQTGLQRFIDQYDRLMQARGGGEINGNVSVVRI